MAFQRPSRADLLAGCSEVGPDDGIDPRTGFHLSRPRVKNRKALQLCAQVAETLALVLAGECDDLLRDLGIVSVQPAPNSAALVVTLAAPTDIEPAAVLERVQRVAGKLRHEVAAAIHRKRVPLLSYRLARD